MRREVDEYDWWRSSIKGERPPVIEGEPQVGFFKRKLVRGGPWVPAAIWWSGERNEDGELEGDENLYCTVGVTPKDPIEEWSRVASNPITQEEYHRLMGDDRTLEDDEADRTPVDLNSIKPVF